MERTVEPNAAVRWLFLLGVATMPILVARVGAITVSDIAFFVATFLALPQLITMRVERGLAAAAILVAIGGTIASHSSTGPGESLLIVARLLYILLLWALLTRHVASSDTAMRQIFGALFIGVILTSVTAMAQVQLGVVVPNSEVYFGRASGLGTHPNGQGGMLALGVAVATGAFLQGTLRRLAGFTIVIGLVGLLLAGSVSGMLATGIGVLVGVLVGGVTARKLFYLGLAGGAAYLLFTSSGRLFPDGVSPAQRFLDTTGRGAGESTLFIRLRTMNYALDNIWANFPELGVGLAARDGWTTEPFLAVHNLLLLVWFQAGIIALAGIIVAVIAGFSAARRARGNVKTPIIMGCAASFAAGMTGPLLYDRFFWLPFLLAFAASRLPAPGRHLAPAARRSALAASAAR